MEKNWLIDLDVRQVECLVDALHKACAYPAVMVPRRPGLDRRHG